MKNTHAHTHAHSLYSCTQDDAYEMMGEHVFLPGGNLRLVEGMLRDVPVMYNVVVQRIEYGSQTQPDGIGTGGGAAADSSVKVHTSAGTFMGA